MHISEFANDLTCQHCWKHQKTDVWPVNGDYVAFYYQKEPCNYTLKVTCPHCGKDWYVVWDENPGPMERLSL
jgi:Zn finger protein HypA/HybF involved in hydrogenase expression